MGIKVKLEKVRISYPALFEAKDYKNDAKFAYSAKFLVEKGSENDKKIIAAIKEVAEDTFGKKAVSVLEDIKPDKRSYFYRDGDKGDDDRTAGCMVAGARRQAKDGPPKVKDADKTDLTADSGRIYAGCYVNALIEVYAQDGANKGVRCGLMGVQFAGDGPAFGGAGRASDDDFDDLSSGASDDFDPS